MRPAEGKPQLLAAFGQRSISPIAIDLQNARKTAQMRFWPFRFAIWRIDIGHHRRIHPAPWAIIARIGPNLTSLGSPAPRLEDWRRGFIGKQPLGLPQPFKDMVTQGPQIPRRPPHPVGECRAVEQDVLAGVDLRLPIQRQVIGVFGRQHLRDQCFGGDSTLDNAGWRRSLHNGALA